MNQGENKTNEMWKSILEKCLYDYSFVVKPRGMEVRELIAASYTVKMPAYLDLKARKVNLPFMFAEAAWILSGSNRLSGVEPYMKGYRNFSDDGVFLRGAYGPKVTEQLPYVVDTLVKDNDTRQAVMTIWRERPSGSKDVPCTVAMQFFIREGNLHLITTMRSNDAVLGFTFDVFTFSMVAKAVQLLLADRGVDVDLGSLTVNPGSLHLYETHYKEAAKWVQEEERDMSIQKWVTELHTASTYEELIDKLKELAHESKFYRNRYDRES